MDFANKHVLIVGLAKSGAAVARFLKKRKATVTVTDMADETKLGSLVSEMKNMDIRLELGGHNLNSFERADLIVLSPGVPHTMPQILSAAAKGIPCIGEMELASRFVKAPMIAVTGTNGKTTTTTLLGQMLKDSGFKVFVGGNIGTPLIEYADSPQTADLVVVEVSSFQLDTIQTFRPKVGVLLNITADHLDRYPNFDGYVSSKQRLFENHQKDDFAIVNGADPHIRGICRSLDSTCCFFDGREETENGAVIEANCITLHMPDRADKILDLSSAILPGRHNRENVAAAALAALAAGGSLKGIQAAVNRFKGLPHRIEHIASIGGVQYFNDSKATNVDAVARALECFDRRTILIMGGRDKGGGYEALKQRLQQQAKKLIVMGEAKATIKSALESVIDLQEANTMEGAVALAAQFAEAGDTILLSPACSSFDMYKSYGERGEDFRRCVLRLKHQSTG